MGGNRKSGCLFPLSAQVIVREEAVEREETGLGLYVCWEIGETNFHLLSNALPGSALGKSARPGLNHFI